MDLDTVNDLKSSLKALGYEQGTSLREEDLPEVIRSFAEQRTSGNLSDYLVISLPEYTGRKEEGLYEILVKRK